MGVGGEDRLGRQGEEVRWEARGWKGHLAGCWRQQGWHRPGGGEQGGGEQLAIEHPQWVRGSNRKNRLQPGRGMGDRVPKVLASKEPEMVSRWRRNHFRMSHGRPMARPHPGVWGVGKQTATTTEDCPETMASGSASPGMVQKDEEDSWEEIEEVGNLAEDWWWDSESTMEVNWREGVRLGTDSVWSESLRQDNDQSWQRFTVHLGGQYLRQLKRMK